jgi:ankyrin
MGALAMCKMLESGDLEGAAGLLDAEPTLMEQVGPDGTRSTPLIRTARAGQLELVKFLVRRGANMHAISSRGQTPLHCAAEEGHEEVAAYLLDNGAQPSYQDTDGMTPLMSATKRRHIGMALLLLDYMGGEGLEAVDGLGRTVLHWAICGGGHEEVMAHLIRHGARGDIRDNNGETAVEMAVRRGYVGATELLIGHMRPEALQQRDGTGRNLLDTVIDHYLHDMVVYLVSKGLPFAARDNSGTTALMYCARHCSVVQMRRLLEHTAGQGLNDRSSHGNTALHYAVLYYRHENVRALLQAGADPTIVDDLQKTPRMLAQQGTAHRSSAEVFKVRECMPHDV